MLSITTEIPLEIRKYEKKWQIPEEMSRFCVASDLPFSSCVAQFSDLIQAIHPLGTSTVIECSELYSPRQKKIDALFPNGVVEIPYKELESAGSDNYPLRARAALRFLNFDLAFVLDHIESIHDLLAFLKPFEWCISFWNTPPSFPPSLLYYTWERKNTRTEEIYLSKVAPKAEGVLFFSQGHSHMEIMTCSLEFQANVVDALAQLDGNSG